MSRYDYDPYVDYDACGICGCDPCDCACPVCGICGSQGDEGCVTVHGVEQTWMKSEHSRLKSIMEAAIKSEADREAAWLKADMESDESYHSGRGWDFIGTMGDYNEHDDSAYQCGKDRDDR